MQFYARFSWRFIRQLVADLFVVAWTAAWWLTGRAVDATVRMLAEPARRTQDLAADLQRHSTAASEQAARVPVVGPELRGPFDRMAETLGELALSAGDQVAQIEFLATLAGWLIFLMPTLLVVALWLPRRIRFALGTKQVRALAATEAGRDLLALRALATQPVAQLSAVADDPVAAWRSGDEEVTEQLAELELIGAGVSRPTRRRRITD